MVLTTTIPPMNCRSSATVLDAGTPNSSDGGIASAEAGQSDEAKPDRLATCELRFVQAGEVVDVVSEPCRAIIEWSTSEREQVVLEVAVAGSANTARSVTVGASGTRSLAELRLPTTDGTQYGVTASIGAHAASRVPLCQTAVEVRPNLECTPEYERPKAACNLVGCDEPPRLGVPLVKRHAPAELCENTANLADVVAYCEAMVAQTYRVGPLASRALVGQIQDMMQDADIDYVANPKYLYLLCGNLPKRLPYRYEPQLEGLVFRLPNVRD